MNGRKAKALRRQAIPETSSSSVAEHPLGVHAGVFTEWQEKREPLLRQLVEENRKALASCTGEDSCTSSLHQPGCYAVS